MISSLRESLCYFPICLHPIEIVINILYDFIGSHVIRCLQESLCYSPICLHPTEIVVYILYRTSKSLLHLKLRLEFMIRIALLSYRIVSHLIVSYLIVSYRIVSCHIVSYRILSYRVVSYRIVCYRIVSHLIVSCRIVSCRFPVPDPENVGNEEITEIHKTQSSVLSSFCNTGSWLDFRVHPNVVTLRNCEK